MGYVVYKHTSPSGKVYIGITSKKPEYRWERGKGYKRHPYFFNAIVKYGWDNIIHEILHDNLTKSQAIFLEKKYIAIYKALGISYNLTDGGEGVSGVVRVLTPTWRAKISQAHKGKHHTSETRRKMSESRKGIKQASEWVEKRIQANKRAIEASNGINTFRFSSIQEASKTLNIVQGNISAVCRKKRKTAGGFKFRYI